MLSTTEVSHHEALDLAHLYRRPFCMIVRFFNGMSVTPYYVDSLLVVRQTGSYAI